MEVKQEALQVQRDHTIRFVTGNNKRGLHAHSRSLVLMPFDKLSMIN